MQNIFLIGNGFDLHHNLLTKYYDFMCVATALTSSPFVRSMSIGEIFKHCSQNSGITKYYNSHKDFFDKQYLDFNKIDPLYRLHNNFWFKYFSKTINIDDSWIDFEKEIATVVSSLNKIIPTNCSLIHLSLSDKLYSYILSNFNFFIGIGTKTTIGPGNDYCIKDEYLKMYPPNSGIYVANKEKIFEELYSELCELRQAFCIYLRSFVEDVMCDFIKNDSVKPSFSYLFQPTDIIISFNYTNTIEHLYKHKNILHIHGTTMDGNIVLGINSNESDQIGTIDTSIISFKKYYQRLSYETDRKYVKWCRNAFDKTYEYRVIVIGHSLDETDKDIIKDVLSNAKETYIAYHNPNVIASYRKNLVNLFGYDGLDYYRKHNTLDFIPLSDIERTIVSLNPSTCEDISTYDTSEKIDII